MKIHKKSTHAQRLLDERRRKQSGFTLVGMAFMIATLILLYPFVVDAIENFHMSNLAKDMKKLQNGYGNQKRVLGCGARTIGGLFREKDFVGNAGDGNTCGSKTFSEKFTAYYLKDRRYSPGVVATPSTPAIDPHINLDNIVKSAKGEIVSDDRPGGPGLHYVIKGLSESRAKSVYEKCSGLETHPDNTVVMAKARQRNPCSLDTPEGETDKAPGLYLGQF